MGWRFKKKFPSQKEKETSGVPWISVRVCPSFRFLCNVVVTGSFLLTKKSKIQIFEIDCLESEFL